MPRRIGCATGKTYRAPSLLPSRSRHRIRTSSRSGPHCRKPRLAAMLGTRRRRLTSTFSEPDVPTNRRNFLKASAVAAGAIGLDVLPGLAPVVSAGTAASTRPVERAGAPLNILILGGTGFTGPEQVEYA